MVRSNFNKVLLFCFAIVLFNPHLASGQIDTGGSILFHNEKTGSSELATTVTTPVTVKVAMLHLYPQLNQLQYNLNLLSKYVTQALQGGAKIVVTPELVTTGYCITPSMVRDSLGIPAPNYPKLSFIRNLAMQYGAYIVIGFAEIGTNDSLYNSAIMYSPDGSYFLQRKRGVAYWNTRGNLPFGVMPTPYGNIGLAICSDTYLMDWMRIMTINGANLILTPANWWGTGQVTIWKTRAYENGINMVVANRWGTETDTRFGPPYTYYMNDGPSAVVNPGVAGSIAGGDQVQYVYRSQQVPNPSDTVLYQNVTVNTGANNTWMYYARQPAAYTGIASGYYLPAPYYQPAPNLPAAGTINTGIMSYWPSTDPQTNLNKMYAYWNASSKNTDVLVLPSYSTMVGLVNGSNPGWYNSFPWTNLQSFVNSNNIKILTTSFVTLSNSQYNNGESIAIFQAGKTPILIPEIHSWWNSRPAPVPPLYIDIPNKGRVGVLLDHDALMPETTMDLAKLGADLIIYPFDYGTTGFISDTTFGDNWPYDLIETYSNVCCHIAASNDYGFGMIVNNGGGYIASTTTTNADAGNEFQIVGLPASTVRTKYLNYYYNFDLQSLLGSSYNAGMVSALEEINKNPKSPMDYLPNNESDKLFELRRQVLPPGMKVER